MSQSTDTHQATTWSKLHRSFTGLGGDLQFVDAFFTYLRTQTNLLDTPTSITQIQQAAKKHCDLRAEEIKKNKSASSTTATTLNSTTPIVSSPPSAQPSAISTTDSSLVEPSSSLPSFPSNSSTGKSLPIRNGGETERYSWTQSLSEVTVQLKPTLPLALTARQLNVSLDTDRISITNKSSGDILLQGNWHSRIHSDDATWTLEQNKEKTGKVLMMYLPKSDRMSWWPCVIKGDAEIDVTKIEPENSQLGDLDRDTRQTVEKMMYDQRAKASGQKTSEELTKEAALQRFMAAHPEMDFSQAKIS